MKNFGAGGASTSGRTGVGSDGAYGPGDPEKTSRIDVPAADADSEPSGSAYGLDEDRSYGEGERDVNLRIDGPRERSGRGPVILLGLFSVTLLVCVVFLGMFAYKQWNKVHEADEAVRVAEEEARAANERADVLSETVKKKEAAAANAEAASKSKSTASSDEVADLKKQVETLTKERDEQKKRADEAEKKSKESAESIDMQLDPSITAHHVELSGESWDYWLYRARPTAKNQPLILSLHGSSEVGGSLDDLRSASSLARPVMSGEYKPDCIVVCPVSSGEWDAEHLKELVDHIVDITGADKTRLGVTGVSLGGFGTWSLLAEYPEYFATAAPVASSAYDLDRLANVKTKVLALVGSADGYDSQAGVDAINGGGGSAKQVWVDGASHSDMCNIYSDSKYNPVPFLLGKDDSLFA